jgi:hypothetical protein
MKIQSLLWRLVPSQNNNLYYVAKRYVDRYNNENNDSMRSNGELQLMYLVLPHCKCVFDVGANIGDWTGT